MPTNPKLADVIALLKRGTESRQLHWQTTPDENTFRVSLGAGLVRLSKDDSFGAASSRSYTLTLLNHSGQVLDEYTPEREEDKSSLIELFGIARRSALGLDGVLDQMLQELKARVG